MRDISHAPAAQAPVQIQTRMNNPAALIPEGWEGIQKLLVAVRKGDLPASTLDLTHMLASEINGCSACMEGAIRHAHRSGELDERPAFLAVYPRRAAHSPRSCSTWR